MLRISATRFLVSCLFCKLCDVLLNLTLFGWHTSWSAVSQTSYPSRTRPRQYARCIASQARDCTPEAGCQSNGLESRSCEARESMIRFPMAPERFLHRTVLAKPSMEIEFLKPTILDIESKPETASTVSFAQLGSEVLARVQVSVRPDMKGAARSS